MHTAEWAKTASQVKLLFTASFSLSWSFMSKLGREDPSNTGLETG